MATTKFLDYTGLSKLVEKIKNTYVRQDSQYEANLQWGGKNFADSYGPIDAARIPDLGANRFDMGAAEGITIEYSNDAGATWEDYGTSDFNKVSLISSLNNYSGFCIGKTKSSSPANDMLRVTIDTSIETGINSYFTMNKVYVHCSTNGSKGCYCTIQKALQSTPTVFTDVVTKVPISGWTGYNIINTPSITTYGNLPSSQYGRLRFIFGNTGNTSDYSGLTIMKIKAYGNGYIRLPGNLARLGVPYTIEGTDSSVKFPANVTATQFVGSLNGNATSATKIGTSTVGSSTKPVYINSGTPTACSDTISVSITGNAATATKATNADNAAKVNSHTVNSDVPSNAVFTDKNVTQYVYTGNTASYNYPLLIGTSENAQETVTDIASVTSKILANPAIGSIKATNFEGNINGHSVESNVPSNAKFTDSHYTTGLRVGASGTGSNAATTNGNTYIKVTDDGTYREGHLIKGTGATTVVSDANGNITINSTNTTYSNATTSSPGLMSAADKSKLDNSVLTNVWDGKNGYIKLGDKNIIRWSEHSGYDIIINGDNKGGFYIYDGASSKGTNWGINGIDFEKFPTNVLLGAHNDYATAVSTTDIQSWIDEAITL